MSWSVGYNDNLQRDIGYGVPAVCDHPDCEEEIDRGLSYVCGVDPYGGEYGCGLHFCGKHLYLAYPEGDAGPVVWLCERCLDGKEPFDPKPDTQEWVTHKLTDESWAKLRAENPDWVAEHAPTLPDREA